MKLIHHRGRKFETITPDGPNILADIQKPDADADLVRAADQIAFNGIMPTLGAEKGFVPLRGLGLWRQRGNNIKPAEPGEGRGDFLAE